MIRRIYSNVIMHQVWRVAGIQHTLHIVYNILDEKRPAPAYQEDGGGGGREDGQRLGQRVTNGLLAFNEFLLSAQMSRGDFLSSRACAYIRSVQL